MITKVGEHKSAADGRSLGSITRKAKLSRRRLTGAINRVNAGKARLDPAAAPKQSHPLGSGAEADYLNGFS